MTTRLGLARGFLAFATCLLLAGPAAATHISLPDLTIWVGPEDNPTEVTASMLETQSASVVQNADDSITFSDGSMSTDMWTWFWDEITLKEDPIVSFAQSFTNLSGGAVDFVFSTTLVTGPIGPSTLIGGSSSVTVSDADNSGSATLSNTTGLPGYDGRLDGVTTLTLLDPFSLTALSGGTNATSQSAGLPGPSIGAPAVVNTIGIAHHFNLTSHDSATFDSTFIVEVVPEPATVLLLGFGSVGLAVLSRRVRR